MESLVHAGIAVAVGLAAGAVLWRLSAPRNVVRFSARVRNTFEVPGSMRASFLEVRTTPYNKSLELFRGSLDTADERRVRKAAFQSLVRSLDSAMRDMIEGSVTSFHIVQDFGTDRLWISARTANDECEIIYVSEPRTKSIFVPLIHVREILDCCAEALQAD